MIKKWESFKLDHLEPEPKPNEDQLNNLIMIKDIFQEVNDVLNYPIEYRISIPYKTPQGKDARVIYDEYGKFRGKWSERNTTDKITYCIKILPHGYFDVEEKHKNIEDNFELIKSCIERARSLDFLIINPNIKTFRNLRVRFFEITFDGTTQESINESNVFSPTKEELNNLGILKDIFQDFEDLSDMNISYTIWVMHHDQNRDDHWLSKEFDLDGKLVDSRPTRITDNRIYYKISIKTKYHYSKDGIFKNCIDRAKSLGFEMMYNNDLNLFGHILIFKLEEI